MELKADNKQWVAGLTVKIIFEVLSDWDSDLDIVKYLNKIFVKNQILKL